MVQEDQTLYAKRKVFSLSQVIDKPFIQDFLHFALPEVQVHSSEYTFFKLLGFSLYLHFGL